MNIRTKNHVWVVTLGVTFIACCVVTLAILLVYPRDKWVSELVLSLSLTVGLTIGFTRLLAGMLLKNQRLSDELQRLVDRDRLTNVSTRDHFFTWIDDPEPFSGVTLMIDIDHFKAVNDTYGHLAGDMVIRHIADALQLSVRANDLVARFGGEEFLIFLRGYVLDDAYGLAERMRQRVETTGVLVDGKMLHVTVSIGAAYKGRFDKIEVAIGQADAALYHAKSAGRNQCCIHGPRFDAAG